MLGAINKQIPTTTTVVPLNDPKRYANLKTRSGELLIKPRTLTVENAEQVHPVLVQNIKLMQQVLACYMRMEMYKLRFMQMLHLC